MATSILEINIGRRGKVKDRTGVRSGKLLAIEYAGKDETQRKALWRCVCDCGKEVIVTGSQLNGKQQSCGCIRSEITKKHPVDWTINITHNDSGKVRAKEYNTWSSMIQRCTNKNHVAYKNYGGRGIDVCAEWRDSYENFLSDMGRKPSKHHSIERINVDGGYSKDNCIWATYTDQQNNRRDTCYVTFSGERMSVAELYKKFQIPNRTLYNWYEKSIDKDLTKKINDFLAKHPDKELLR